MIKIKRVYEEVDESDDLRKWFSHEPEKWAEFKRRYFEELKDKKRLIDLIIEKSQSRVVTLLYGAKDEKYNNAVALKEYIPEKENEQ